MGNNFEGDKSMDLKRLEVLKNQAKAKHAKRIVTQLEYAVALNDAKGGFDSVITQALDMLYADYEADGLITKDAATKAEQALNVMSDAAKAIKIMFAAHAHIDMNWMWGYAETVAITLDTFRTMLTLMDEYPEYIFSQSQASVYRIVEEYDPAMLEQIKRRVAEGRWEVTATTWVEADKNMPSAESMARHQLYTRQYLSTLLDLPEDDFTLDFEPDTFGHAATVPEVLNNAGVKYYYHCRGDLGPNIYNWEAPSGARVLVYREPDWYNSRIDAASIVKSPSICKHMGFDTMLSVYGVGDHGGGPTRQDIESILEMSTWPVFPTLCFARIKDYFKLLEQNKEKFPVINREQNFIFSGCYTTQTRIKAANKIGEARLYDSEALAVMAGMLRNTTDLHKKYHGAKYAEAWERLLFSQFHDILTGSGVTRTREYAMGESEKTMAFANTQASLSMRAIASRGSSAVTSSDTAFGSGVGYGIEDFTMPQTERGHGSERVYNIFNTTPTERTEVAEITIWDWPGEYNRLVIKDAKGNILTHQLFDTKPKHYWGHKYMRVWVYLEVPAMGMATVTVSDGEPKPYEYKAINDWRVERAPEYVLENEHVKVCFDRGDATITSFIDKHSGAELIDTSKKAGVFELVHEDDIMGMTAWIVGRHMSKTQITEDVRITSYTGEDMADVNDLVRQSLSFIASFGDSQLSVTISLDKDSRYLNYDIECDWQQRPVKGKYIPQLFFSAPLGYKAEHALCDIPAGTILRKASAMDVPCQSFMAAVAEQKSSLAIIARTKYGFRFCEDNKGDTSLGIDLIRSSYDPDPYPELGMHRMQIRIGCVNLDGYTQISDDAFAFLHPLHAISSGSASPECVSGGADVSAISVKGARVSAVKYAEDGEAVVIRLYENEGKDAEVVINSCVAIKDAYYCDIHEKKIAGADVIEINDNGLRLRIKHNSLVSIGIELK